jgi:hypothetical protein
MKRCVCIIDGSEWVSEILMQQDAKIQVSVFWLIFLGSFLQGTAFRKVFVSFIRKQ